MIRGRLTPEVGAVVQRALEAAVDRLSQEAAGSGTHDRSIARADATIGQRHADALALLAETALTGGLDPGTAGDRYQVVLHVDRPAPNYHGVIDHNTLTGPGNSTFLQIIGRANDAPPPSQAGTANNMFVEDNTITFPTMTNAGRGCLDLWGIGAVVWRQNATLNCLVTSHGVTHGSGPQNIELYDNRLAVDAGAVAQGVADGYRLFHHPTAGWLTISRTPILTRW